jgi:nucleoside-diphosphate-sugar epimerase
MQNIAGYKTAILNGTYPMPYASAARISLVDLRDVAEVAAKMFVTDIGLYGTYELVGTQPLSQVDVARALSKHFERPVKAIEVSKEEWEQAAIKNQMSVYSRETLLSMFRYYDTFGLTGSPTTLTCLLGRKPITIEQYLQDELSTLS